MRTEWNDAYAAALVKHKEAADLDAQIAALPSRAKAEKGLREKSRAARDESIDIASRFHTRLCNVRVLDPACGTGNFLYVTLEHLKRLEGEVLNALDELGYRQAGLALSERADAMAGETVDPHNLLGIEINPRAAAIAEVVLWIGYLQWHFRTRGDVTPPQPVIRDFRNIETRDAVLAYDRVEFVTDERGVPVTRWDGRTMKSSPVTGEPIPDEAARVPVERYVNPRKAGWPQADFIVGNPPFIGNKRMRTALGDGYVEALRKVWQDVPETSDFVMYWWHHAAQLARRGALRRFGLITINSISQAFNRRVIENAMAPAAAKGAARKTAARPSPTKRGAESEGSRNHATSTAAEPSFGASHQLTLPGEQPVTLVFAIPDHPWVDAADGAAVRISMTIGEASGAGGAGAIRGGNLISVAAVGRLAKVVAERVGADGEIEVVLSELSGVIHSDLSAGAKVVATRKLQANANICFQGMNLVGKGFRIEAEEVAALGYDVGALPDVIKPHCNARDLMQGGEHCYVIDLFGMTAEEARARHPSLYQHLIDRVKPERDHNNRVSYRERWWVFGEARSRLRVAWEGCTRVILTPETAKYGAFVFQELPFAPDHSIYVITSDDSFLLGVLSATPHRVWSLAAGSTLEDRPRWRNVQCFLPFAFPEEGRDGGAVDRIRHLAEQLDAHRKRKQAAHPGLTITGMYNVLEKLRSGEALTAKERVIHEQGLVSVLRQIHDDLDAAVLDAYGWSDLLPLLRIAHGNEPPAEGQSREDAKRAFDEAILERLVALNAERAAEEARGIIRWLRPEFQNPELRKHEPEQDRLAIDSTAGGAAATPAAGDDRDDEAAGTDPDGDTDGATNGDTDTNGSRAAAGGKTAAAAVKPQPWPSDPVAQVRAVADLLAASPVPLSIDDIAARFTGRGPWKKRLPQLLEMLVALGRAQRRSDGHWSGA